MAEQLDGVLTDLDQLPPVGTPERREWDDTVREVNELFPDWWAINVGKARLRRETYDQHYQGAMNETRSSCVPLLAPGRPATAARGRTTNPGGGGSPVESNGGCPPSYALDASESLVRLRSTHTESESVYQAS